MTAQDAPRKLLRGRILTFHSEPIDDDDTDAFDYFEDGALILAAGRIEAIGDYATLAPQASGLEVIDHRPHLMMAGFIDAHIHFPQVQVIASWGAQLLDWLNTYTFPAEMRFADPDHCRSMAAAFFDLLIAHGTTSAAAFCTVHNISAEAYFAEARKRNMRVIGGKVLMDRNAPAALCDTPQTGYDATKRLIADWHDQGRAQYAITPRFAITSTAEQLDMAGTLCKEHPDCFVQTHLSENFAEIALTTDLFPKARDYLDIYEIHQLLGPKTLLGHAIHLSDRERDRIAETGAHPVFCPTSNLFLGSGLFDAEAFRARNVSSAIATDIGAGTSYSMLATLTAGYQILQLQGQKLHSLQAFHWITRGNAVALGLDDRIGTLDAGTEADIVVLNSRATPAMSLRADQAGCLSEELFILQIMGDDRAVAEVYVAGVPMKAELQNRFCDPKYKSSSQ